MGGLACHRGENTDNYRKGKQGRNKELINTKRGRKTIHTHTQNEKGRQKQERLQKRKIQD